MRGGENNSRDNRNGEFGVSLQGESLRVISRLNDGPGHKFSYLEMLYLMFIFLRCNC